MNGRVVTLAQAIDEALAHQNAGRLDDAERIYRQVLGVAPRHATALHQLALIAAGAGRLSQAIDLVHEALDADPRLTVGYANLGNLLKADGRIEAAVQAYRTALLLDPDQVAVHRSLLNALLYLPLGPEQRFAEHLAFAARHQPPPDAALPPPRNDRDPERRLRIGVVSADLCRHPVARILMPLLADRERRATAVFCYADVPSPDHYTERLRALSDGWRSTVGLSDRAIAELVRADAVDLLLLLAGVFDRNRPLVACYRPAPVQIAMLDGGTTGLRGMDYWLTDPVVHPPDTVERFTERLVRIPSALHYPGFADAPAVGPLPAAANGFVTFACFSRPAKIGGVAIALWAAVLRAQPTARVAFKYMDRFADPAARTRLRLGFGAHGIAPERIAFLPDDTQLGYLDAYNTVDVMFDTVPFSGATTTFEALWMGVPVLTLAGDTAMARWSATLLHAAGLAELATDDADAFVARAGALVGDLGALASLRAGLRARVARSPLCDGPAYARSLEALFRRLWRDWCAGAAGGADG